MCASRRRGHAGIAPSPCTHALTPTCSLGSSGSSSSSFMLRNTGPSSATPSSAAREGWLWWWGWEAGRQRQVGGATLDAGQPLLACFLLPGRGSLPLTVPAACRPCCRAKQQQAASDFNPLAHRPVRMPHSRAMCRAVWMLSPVTMRTKMPAFWQVATAAGTSLRTGSCTARAGLRVGNGQGQRGDCKDWHIKVPQVVHAAGLLR